jgi:hypothetical protein
MSTFHESQFEPAPQPRVSFLAVLSLICGIVCVPPGTGLLALIFGASGAVLIGRSGGRLRGKGLCLTGIVLGVISTFMWIAFAVGAASAYRGIRDNIALPTAEFVEALRDGDHAGAIAMMHTDAAERLTAERLEGFREEVTAKLGAFQGLPDQPDFFRSNASPGSDQVDLGPSMIPLPFPAQFENGGAFIVLVIDGSELMDMVFGQLSIKGRVHNLLIFGEDQQMMWLLPPEGP